MSRIYDNKPLSALPVSNVNWQKPWSEQEFTSEGNGVLLEGIVNKRHRIAITDSQNGKYRYFLIHLKVERAHNRQFESSGKEIEPNFGETEKIRTGFLHSSYKVSAKGVSDSLSASAVKSKLEKDELTGIQKEKASDGVVVVWLHETHTQAIEINNGDKVRIKTKGDSPYVETIGKIDAVSSTVSNYAGGDQVGASWTDKVMMVKAQSADSEPSGGGVEQGEGADDEEWDD